MERRALAAADGAPRARGGWPAGGSAYDDRVVRARLAQAFGRLIRRAERSRRVRDPLRGDAVRLLTAFPPGVPISRLPLDEAIERVEQRLAAAPVEASELV